MPAKQITVPNVRLDLEDLLDLIRHLDVEARRRVAQTLAEAEIDGRFGDLIRKLAVQKSVDEISDADIDLEIGAHRRQRRSA